ncbi:MAG: hypothetical protein HMLKMBBP_00446 [Planctomycetes bacterium]|nr:hypothetical protein [Planctomycetota bacterium]
MTAPSPGGEPAVAAGHHESPAATHEPGERLRRGPADLRRRDVVEHDDVGRRERRGGIAPEHRRCDHLGPPARASDIRRPRCRLWCIARDDERRALLRHHDPGGRPRIRSRDRCLELSESGARFHARELHAERALHVARLQRLAPAGEHDAASVRRESRRLERERLARAHASRSGETRDAVRRPPGDPLESNVRAPRVAQRPRGVRPLRVRVREREIRPHDQFARVIGERAAERRDGAEQRGECGRGGIDADLLGRRARFGRGRAGERGPRRAAEHEHRHAVTCGEPRRCARRGITRRLRRVDAAGAIDGHDPQRRAARRGDRRGKSRVERGEKRKRGRRRAEQRRGGEPLQSRPEGHDPRQRTSRPPGSARRADARAPEGGGVETRKYMDSTRIVLEPRTRRPYFVWRAAARVGRGDRTRTHFYGGDESNGHESRNAERGGGQGSG